MNLYKKFNSLILCVLITLLLSCKHQKKEFAIEKSFVKVGSNQLRVFVGGEGENTIVFESGLGVDGATWIESGIFDSIGKDNQVIAYDRLGYGKSSPAYEPRGLEKLVDDLDSIIIKKSKNNKVIIVGHSLGGAIARTYAIKHPYKIKALLFIEPNNEKFKKYSSMSQEKVDTLMFMFQKEKLSGPAMEAFELIKNISFLEQLPSLPDIPIIVISSVKADDEMTPEVILDWSQSHAALGEGISNFTQIKTNKSGHFVYEEEPNLVIENINKLIEN